MEEGEGKNIFIPNIEKLKINKATLKKYAFLDMDEEDLKLFLLKIKENPLFKQN